MWPKKRGLTAWCAAAVGTTRRRTAGRRIATGTLRAMPTTTWASASPWPPSPSSRYGHLGPATLQPVARRRASRPGPVGVSTVVTGRLGPDHLRDVRRAVGVEPRLKLPACARDLPGERGGRGVGLGARCERQARGHEDDELEESQRVHGRVCGLAGRCPNWIAGQGPSDGNELALRSAVVPGRSGIRPHEDRGGGAGILACRFAGHPCPVFPVPPRRTSTAPHVRHRNGRQGCRPNRQAGSLTHRTGPPPPLFPRQLRFASPGASGRYPAPQRAETL